jgi:putative tryptophan/tyrosine transport system substrate-binding protein
MKNHIPQSRRRFLQAGAQLTAQAMFLSTVSRVWTPIAHAQPAAKATRVGFVGPGPRPATDQVAPFLAAFREGLRNLGWNEGETFVIETRFADGKLDRIPALVAELAGLNVRAILVVGSPAAAIVGRETKIPMVMIGDPIGTKLAATLDRPGGTVTGLASNSKDICVKRLKLLKTVVPGLTRAAFVAKPDNPAIPGILQTTRAAAEELRVQLIPVDVHTESDMETAFEDMTRAAAEAFIFYPVPMREARVREVADIAIKRRLAWLDEIPFNARLGALLGYGADYPELFRRAAGYVDKILKGANPADLAIGVPDKVELVVNLRTAQALNLTIPQSVLAEATNVTR